MYIPQRVDDIETRQSQKNMICAFCLSHTRTIADRPSSNTGEMRHAVQPVDDTTPATRLALPLHSPAGKNDMLASSGRCFEE